jgi:CBS-domain-containing membrane protein
MPLNQFFQKMRGGKHCPPRAPMIEVFWSTLGGCLGIAAVYFTATLQGIKETDALFLIGSFGASAVLLYGIPLSPFAQPRNLLGGHVISAIIGVSCYLLLAKWPGAAAALAVGLSIGAMHLTRTLHPPGGASALIAVIAGPRVHELGYWYAISPVAIGATLMLLVAVIINNIAQSRHYPEYWW